MRRAASTSPWTIVHPGTGKKRASAPIPRWGRTATNNASLLRTTTARVLDAFPRSLHVVAPTVRLRNAWGGAKRRRYAEWDAQRSV